MHSGYEIPGIQHQQPPETTWNQTHILEQTQQLLLDQHHILQHQTMAPDHHYVGAATAASQPYFPLNFKLGLNEICTRNNHGFKNGGVGVGEDGLLRGGEGYQPDTSLGMLHPWQNQQDSAIKQQPFWEPLPAEVSNENSEIVDRQDTTEMNQKEAPTACLDGKNRVQFSELDAIYKRLGSTSHHHPADQIGTNEILPESVGPDPSPEGSAGEEVRNAGKKRKKERKKKGSSFNDEFFGELVKQVMDHQENLHRKFTQVIEKLDEERRARDEAWRNQELARFEHEAKTRAREKALSESREAVIVSYLERITGQRINLIVADSERQSRR